MSPLHRFGAPVACALMTLAQTLTPANAAESDPLAWREAGTLPALVAHLEDWLDANTDLPRRDSAPDIALIGAARAASMHTSRHASQEGHARGLYDEEAGAIYLVRPWDARNPYDVSVLLHELAHHRQAEAGHWYCPGAQELPAYRLQDEWLGALGLAADVNWVAVVLEAGCTPRDIHPD
ncbi:DUF6647 family protein [Aestuariicoccus sp. MJ-SS9]|uniref:DUF6647 family protein n=1 Tax=Aestuariicoccus sp. MJ-SS9 TaxID=3079855 RepID=UPI00290BBE98|nr:DUF6647 family protein [Aestuariicoccus sp. MJ-SS9]MDU8913640.1 DUF6647 family protein [Aestuariicoccus sp. MJ-SS9]